MNDIREVGDTLRRSWSFVILLDIIAVIVSGYYLQYTTFPSFYCGLIIGILYVLGELYPLDLFQDGDLTLGGLIQVVAILVFGIEATLIGVLLGEFLYGSIRNRPFIKTLFNYAQTVISTTIAYYVFLVLGGKTGTLTIQSLFIPLVFVFVNTLLVSAILAISHRQYIWQAWKMLNKDTLPYSTIISIGGLAFSGLLLSYGIFGLILVIILVISLWNILFQAGYSISAMKKRYKQTIQVLMTALEYRDPSTYGHSSRVSILCRKIAIEMNLSPAEVEKIELGGLMHDIGKVGVSDLILNKPSRLTQEEYEQIKAHTVNGERLLMEMDGMEYIATMAKQHHLYYNGDTRGYPDEVPSKDVVIGSRILTVADAWDAMTTKRYYRSPFTTVEAVLELKRCSGKQFDPIVVSAFMQVLIHEGLISKSELQQIEMINQDELRTTTKTQSAG